MKLLIKNAGSHIIDVLELLLTDLWVNKFEVDVEDIEEDIYIHDKRECSASQGMVLYVRKTFRNKVFITVEGKDVLITTVKENCVTRSLKNSFLNTLRIFIPIISDPYISEDFNQQEFSQIEEIIRESLKKEDLVCHIID